MKEANTEELQKRLTEVKSRKIKAQRELGDQLDLQDTAKAERKAEIKASTAKFMKTMNDARQRALNLRNELRYLKEEIEEIEKLLAPKEPAKA